MPVMTTVFAVIGSGGLVSSLILIVLHRWLDKHDKQQEIDRNDRREERVVSINLLLAVGTLSRACGIALRDQHINGEMSDAITGYDKAREDMKGYLVQKYASNL